MKLRLIFTAAAFGIGCATLAFAADEPQKERQELMKGVGGATGTMAKMVKGEEPFDQAAVIAALETISANVEKFPELFPEGSETGMETEAAPAIWENMEDFRAKADKLQSDADAILADPPADLDGLKAVFGPLTKNCGACHETYRIKKS
ncbi:c-type cytochrome [Pseudohoeflea coraliihabitans]|uniref:Cytochrome c n=1 Tax=Pseudohoeflea coraliihabitans TaxID=2860393 RepID=A0ABS6WU89_9HYPH|nr:cytochrome c [Pseudohoeflea sp. DP4N28-3]MBW3098624.1 cytochrome c [Pseudohoeflea sp. DP4N28-3]